MNNNDGIIWFGFIAIFLTVWVASAAIRAPRDVKREQRAASMRRHPAGRALRLTDRDTMRLEQWEPSPRPDAADLIVARWKGVRSHA